MRTVLFKYRSQIILSALLLIFILCKLNALNLPYFWDELGVYSRAGLYLHDHGLSLLPKDLPPELSRGHPMLFSFINGLSYTIFGDSLLTGHITALFMSVLFILALYYIFKKYFNAPVALGITATVLLQPLFFAQSVLVLPEVALALFIWLSIYFFSDKRMGYYCLYSGMAMLIKETAIIIPFVVIIADLLIHLAGRQNLRRNMLKKYIVALFPLLVFALFLLLQKQQNGWYFFPYHTQSVNFDLKPLVMQFTDFSKFLTMEQGRLYLSGIVLIVFALLHIQKWMANVRSYLWDIVLFVLSLAMFFLLYNDADAIFCVCFLLCALLLGVRYLMKNNLPSHIVYCIVLMGGGLCFSATNFYMNRYVLFLLPALFALYYYTVKPLFSRNRIAAPAALVIIAWFAFINMRSSSFHYDEDMSYENYLRLQVEVVHAVDSDLTGKQINVFANFPIYHSLSDPRLGYTDKTDDVDFHLIKGNDHPTVFDFIIIADPGSYGFTLPQNDSIAIMHSFENETGKVTLYKATYKE